MENKYWKLISSQWVLQCLRRNFCFCQWFSEEKTGIKISKEHFIVIGSTSACNDKNRCEKCQYFEYHLILGIYKMPLIFPQIYCKVCALSKFSILALPLSSFSPGTNAKVCQLCPYAASYTWAFLPSEQPTISVIAHFWEKVCDSFHFQSIVINTKKFSYVT